MNTCPHCGGRALSLWQKIKMGPAAVGRCRECGSEFSSPYWSALFALPFLLAVLGGFVVLSFGTYFLVATVTLAFMIVGRLAFVPLYKVESPPSPRKKKSGKRR